MLDVAGNRCVAAFLLVFYLTSRQKKRVCVDSGKEGNAQSPLSIKHPVISSAGSCEREESRLCAQSIVWKITGKLRIFPERKRDGHLRANKPPYARYTQRMVKNPFLSAFLPGHSNLLKFIRAVSSRKAPYTERARILQSRSEFVIHTNVVARPYITPRMYTRYTSLPCKLHSTHTRT